jgi:hypothetical protein
LRAFPLSRFVGSKPLKSARIGRRLRRNCGAVSQRERGTTMKPTTIGHVRAWSRPAMKPRSSVVRLGKGYDVIAGSRLLAVKRR